MCSGLEGMCPWPVVDDDHDGERMTNLVALMDACVSLLAQVYYLYYDYLLAHGN